MIGLAVIWSAGFVLSATVAGLVARRRDRRLVRD